MWWSIEVLYMTHAGPTSKVEGSDIVIDCYSDIYTKKLNFLVYT